MLGDKVLGSRSGSVVTCGPDTLFSWSSISLPIKNSFERWLIVSFDFVNGQDCSLPGREERRKGEETTEHWLQTAPDEAMKMHLGFTKGHEGSQTQVLLAVAHCQGMLLMFTSLILANAAAYTVKIA